MKTVILTRIQYFEGCTRGVLISGDQAFYTLELPWRDNESNVSCIPKGQYTCTPRVSRKYGTTYHVKDVEGRTYILIHSGNVARHTKGCILLGNRYGTLYNQPAVLASKPAIRKFHTLLNNEDFILKVQ